MNLGEVNAHNWVKQHVRRAGDRLTRVENVVWNGMFDTNGCFGGTEFWIENKAPIEPKRGTTKLFSSNHPFSQDQKNFALDQLRAGGSCWAFIATNFRQFLISGWWIEHANEMTADQLQDVAVWWRIKSSSIQPAAKELHTILSQPTPSKPWNNRTKAATVQSHTDTNWNA